MSTSSGSSSRHSSITDVSSRQMPTSDSNQDDEEETEYDDEDEFDEGGVATAKPPDGNSQEGMAAFDILEHVDQLIESNVISSERGFRLKRKYTALVESIETSRAAENTLLKKIREHQLDIQVHQRELERAEGFPETCSSEMSETRQQYLQHQNTLMQSEEIMAELNQEIQRLKEERKQIQLECERMPKQEDFQKKVDTLKKEAQVIEDEIAERKLEIGKLKEAQQVKETRIESLRADIGQFKDVQGKLHDELAAIAMAPLNTPREMDKLRKAISEASEAIKENNKKSQELVHEIQRQTELHNTLTEQLSAEKNRVDEVRRLYEANQVSSESRAKDMADAKEQESTLIEEDASLDLQCKLRHQEFKLLQESVATKNKEKDRELKQLKRADLQLNTAMNSLEQQKKLLEPYVIRAEEVAERKRKREEMLETVRQEVETFRSSLVKKSLSENEHTQKVAEKYDEEHRCREFSKKHLAILKDISRDVVAMTRQRDLRSRDYYKALRESHDVEYQQKIIKNQVEDQQKKLRDLETGLRDFADAYNVVKTERNKAYSQIQTCQQLSAEMREKIKVLYNESEILQNAVDSKGKVLGRAQQALISKNQDRDTQHQELSKVRLQQEETQSDLKKQRETLHKLILQINAMEQTLNRLRGRYEDAVQDRNDMGLQLIERNEEVCVFHEKLNVQDSVSRKGNMELMEKEEEMKFLNMEIARLTREIDISRKTLPEKDVIERDLARCQNQLLSTKEVIKQLEEEVTDASNPERLRLLKGDDPTCAELRDKIEKLQIRLTDQEQKVLEKELLFEQVTRLADRLKKRVDSRRLTTLQVGKKVNSYQSKLREGTRKMMALVSELSLQQALSIRLQQEVNEKETQLEQAYSRLDSGEAPDEESAKEWAKMVRAGEVDANRNSNSEQFLDEGRQLSNGIYTMAEPRPNAYIPESEIELPLPKPYGAHAPFKPTLPGANMRHIRKPQPKPIDI